MKEDFRINSSVIVDGTEVKTFKHGIVSCNIIEVEVGTTGHMGGDAKYGARTYFKIENIASTDMQCRVNGNSIDNVNLVELSFGGDCELDTFCEALRIGYEVLRKDVGNLDLPTIL